MKKAFPKYSHPPIAELVVGLQFDSIPGFTTGHSGWFCREHLGEGWILSEAPPIVEQTESFDGLKPVKQSLQITQDPASRLMVANAAGDRLLQLQNTRFHYNWRKREAEYPRYEQVFAEFHQHFAAFDKFISHSAQLGTLTPNQWELSYIDNIPRGPLWQSPSDFYKILPGLFAHSVELDGVSPETSSAERSYEIIPQRGRLHVAASMVFFGDTPEPSLLLRMTARGPVDASSGVSLKELMDVGHDAAGEAFEQLTSIQAKFEWGRIT